MFELEGSIVHSIISKMIINEELMVRYTDSIKMMETLSFWTL